MPSGHRGEHVGSAGDEGRHEWPRTQQQVAETIAAEPFAGAALPLAPCTSPICRGSNLSTRVATATGHAAAADAGADEAVEPPQTG